MFKIEYVWRELLFRAIEQKQPYFTMTELSLEFKLSTSVISHALFPLRQGNMVLIGKLQSRIIDAEKLLFFWATRRNILKDIIYQTYSSLPVLEREASMPESVLPTAYSSYRLYFHDVPADYENIYFYSNNIKEIQNRFPKQNNKPANLIILKADPYLKIYRKTPLAQIFSDLWNLPEWYAKDFINALLLKIKTNLGI